MLQWSIATTNDRFQMGTILVADDDTKLLRHAQIIPYPGLVNRLFQSVH